MLGIGVMLVASSIVLYIRETAEKKGYPGLFSSILIVGGMSVGCYCIHFGMQNMLLKAVGG